jgi:hypothetical protein
MLDFYFVEDLVQYYFVGGIKVIYDLLFNDLGTLNCVLLNLPRHFYQVYRTCVNNARGLKLTSSIFVCYR